MARAFKVRSAERDAQTDSERLGSISAAVEAAVASIQRERDALRARVDAARDQAAFATGTDYDEYLQFQQDLLLHIMDAISAAGTALAIPTQASISYSDVSNHHEQGSTRELEGAHNLS